MGFDPSQTRLIPRKGRVREGDPPPGPLQRGVRTPTWDEPKEGAVVKQQATMATRAGSAAGEAERARAFVEPGGKEGIVEWHGSFGAKGAKGGGKQSSRHVERVRRGHDRRRGDKGPTHLEGDLSKRDRPADVSIVLGGDVEVFRRRKVRRALSTGKICNG